MKNEIVRLVEQLQEGDDKDLKFNNVVLIAEMLVEVGLYLVSCETSLPELSKTVLKKKDDQEKICSKLQSDLGILKSEIEQYNEEIEITTSLNEDLLKSEIRLVKIKTEKDQLKALIQTLKSHNSITSIEIKSLQDNKSECEQKKKNLLSEKEKLNKEKEKLNNDNACLEKEISKVIRELSAGILEVHKWEDRITDQLDKKTRKLIEDNQSMISDINMKMHRYNEQISTLDSKHAESDELIKNTKKMIKDIADVQAVIDDNMGMLRAHLNENEGLIEDMFLSDEKLDLKAALKKQASAIEEEIDKMDDSLKSILKDNERMTVEQIKEYMNGPKEENN